ncbi:MAG: hypothetical protein ACLTCK_03840, partial [Oscillospiraceae bacterium]
GEKSLAVGHIPGFQIDPSKFCYGESLKGVFLWFAAAAAQRKVFWRFSIRLKEAGRSSSAAIARRWWKNWIEMYSAGKRSCTISI